METAVTRALKSQVLEKDGTATRTLKEENSWLRSGKIRLE